MNSEPHSQSLVYPNGIVDSIWTLPEKTAMPISVLLNEQEVGGVLLTCPIVDVMYFRIFKQDIPKPGIQFRMLDILERSYLIEIVLRFESDKALHMQLNPIDTRVVRFFDLVIQKKTISFHYSDMENGRVISSFTDVDREQLEWMRRNLQLTQDLKENYDYVLIAELTEDSRDESDAIYPFNDTDIPGGSFIGEGDGR